VIAVKVFYTIASEMLACRGQAAQYRLARNQRTFCSRPVPGSLARPEVRCSNAHAAEQQYPRLDQAQLAPCSSWQQPGVPHRTRCVAAAAAAAAAGPADGNSSSSSRSSSPLEGGKSELQSLLHSIPYKRLLLWGFVGAVGWQLHEFFGVSRACT
jgi:hypothetical protein